MGSKTISIVGLGYIGSILLGVIAKKGRTVIGIDVDNEKVNRILNEKKPPIKEKGLDDLFLENKDNIRPYSDFSNIARGDITFICVGTPSDKDGSANLQYIYSAVSEIGNILQEINDYHLIVLRSTVPPGTSNRVVKILESRSGKRCGRDFGYCMNPEFLREGRAIEDFFNPPFTIIGEYDKKSGDILEKFYRDIGVNSNIYRLPLMDAEIFKYINNIFHAIKVSFTNEVSRVCKELDIDPVRLMKIFAEDKILNISPYYMKPGYAFGGSCLPKDVRAFLSFSPIKTPLVEASLSSNVQHIKWSVDKILRYHPKSVCIMGLSFKNGTDDIRQSPYVTLLRLLLEHGIATYYYDPIVDLENTIQTCEVKKIAEKTDLGRIKIFSTSQVNDMDIEVLIIGSYRNIEGMNLSKFRKVIDLQGIFKDEFKNLPNYVSII